MSDGDPTDDFERGLAKLQQNNWYKHALKIAIAIGDGVNTDNLVKFTGNAEFVLKAHDPMTLRKMIHFVTVTSSQIGSQSQGVKADGQVKTKQDAVVDAIKDMQQNDPDWDKMSNMQDAW